MKTNLEWAKNIYWTVDNWKKVVLFDESHFRIHGKHSRFVRIRNHEQLDPAHFNEIVKHSKLICSGKVLAFLE